MRFLSLLAVLIFALSGSLMLAACGQASNSGQENAAEEAVPAHDAAATPETAVPTEGAETLNTAAAVGDHVELTGTAGCGHCQFGKGEGCSMAMQVGDVVYILDGIAEDVEAFNQSNAGKQISVIGSLTDAGDPHHIQVESHTVQM